MSSTVGIGVGFFLYNLVGLATEAFTFTSQSHKLKLNPHEQHLAPAL